MELRRQLGLPEAVGLSLSIIAPTMAMAFNVTLAVGAAGAAAPLDIHVHQALGHKLHHLAQHIDIRALFSKLGKCHSSGGHCEIPLFRLVGRTSTLSGLTMTTQKQMARPSCKPLRATPFAPCSSVNNLHHYRGHYQRLFVSC